jgi:hypothetical protein
MTGMSDTAERLAALIEDSYPYVFCYACLGTKLNESDRDLRNAAQVVMIARKAFLVSRRVCRTCGITADLLTFHPRRT